MDVIGLWTPIEVRALRESHRMSLRQFAAHTGVHRDVLCRWENARHTPQGDSKQILDRVLQLGGQPVYDRMVEILAQWSEGAPGAPIPPA